MNTKHYEKVSSDVFYELGGFSRVGLVRTDAGHFVAKDSEAYKELKKPKAKKSETKLKAKLTDGNWYDVTCQGHAMEIAHAKGLNVLRIE